MHGTHLFLEDPIRMASILEPSKPSFFPSMTKIVGTLGPRSRSVEVISDCLKAGMSVARFDFSWGDNEYHQQTLTNLKLAIKSTQKLCAMKANIVPFFSSLLIYNGQGLLETHLFAIMKILHLFILSVFALVQVMLDTVGPELQVVNKTEQSISLEADSFVVLTPNQDQEATSKLLPINFHGLPKVSNNIVFIV
ncbi:hypothetical protein IFM89_006081 [Coptis chinensis]|uniref:pyruvate kinase n=1 Tax=Coptis chinensis TaxID=261450 RepID=A0A835H3T4_9MAGN|nr:hypothetical protein IFM89_006081 [Coptis chinensis]